MTDTIFMIHDMIAGDGIWYNVPVSDLTEED